MKQKFCGSLLSRRRAWRFPVINQLNGEELRLELAQKLSLDCIPSFCWYSGGRQLCNNHSKSPSNYTLIHQKIKKKIIKKSYLFRCSIMTLRQLKWAGGKCFIASLTLWIWSREFLNSEIEREIPQLQFYWGLLLFKKKKNKIARCSIGQWEKVQ